MEIIKYLILPLSVGTSNENLGPNRQLANQLHKPIKWRVMLSKYREREGNNMTWHRVRGNKLCNQFCYKRENVRERRALSILAVSNRLGWTERVSSLL